MSVYPCFRLIALCIGAIILTGCTSNKIIHDPCSTLKGVDLEKCKHVAKTPCEYKGVKSCEKDYLTTSKHQDTDGDYQYSLSFVELDEQGHFQSRSQLNDVVQYVREQGDGQDIVLFIHGWHHGAKNKDSNVDGFREVLRTIAQRNRSRRITGIYVGWRGEAIWVPWINAATFWDRKNVSINVGQGALVELLDRLTEVSQATKFTRLVSVGHSFGGSVLFSATKNKIYSELLEVQARADRAKADDATMAPQKLTEEQKKDKQLKDITILVNPAIENIQYAPLHDLVNEMVVQHPYIFSPTDTPKLAVFMSENDWATGITFPIGRFFGTLFENQNKIDRENRFGEPVKYSQFWMDLKALGHYRPFVTHTLTSTTDEKLNGDCTPAYQKLISTPPPVALMQTTESDRKDEYTGKGEGWSHDFDASLTKLNHLSNSPAYAPTWVVRVQPRIIDGHNGIFEPQFNCFIEELLLTNIEPPAALPTQ